MLKLSKVVAHSYIDDYQHSNPTTNYKFSYDAMLDTKGNTAIYLLYAHARLESIIKKGSKEHNIDVDELIKSGKVSVILGHQAEIKLAKNLHMFTDVLETVSAQFF